MGRSHPHVTEPPLPRLLAALKQIATTLRDLGQPFALAFP